MTEGRELFSVGVSPIPFLIFVINTCEDICEDDLSKCFTIIKLIFIYDILQIQHINTTASNISTDFYNLSRIFSSSLEVDNFRQIQNISVTIWTRMEGRRSTLSLLLNPYPRIYIIQFAVHGLIPDT